VFAGAAAARPLSNMVMLMLLGRMGLGDLTAHGFRSTFSDWCAERTNTPSEVRAMALAHAVGDKGRGRLLHRRAARRRHPAAGRAMTDRLSLTNALAAGNIERQAAERIATEIFDAIHDNVATKSDVAVVQADLRRTAGITERGTAAIRRGHYGAPRPR
jgi:hypothetical protein